MLVLDPFVHRWRIDESVSGEVEAANEVDAVDAAIELWEQPENPSNDYSRFGEGLDVAEVQDASYGVRHYLNETRT